MVTTITTRTHRPGTRSRRRPAAAWTLAAVEVIVAGNAVFGGVELIRTGYGLPLDWLAHTPFTAWTWPGVLLIVAIAVPHALAAAAALVQTSRAPRLGWVTGYLAGGSLILWIVIQLAVIQRFSFLQPVLVAFGLVEIGLAEWLRRSVARNRDAQPA